jgi:hypothetical protein
LPRNTDSQISAPLKACSFITFNRLGGTTIERKALHLDHSNKMESIASNLERRRASLAGPNAKHRFEIENENLAVADLFGSARALNRLDDLGKQVVGDRDFDLDLGNKAHGVLIAAIDLGLALLPAEATNFADGHTLDTEAGERIPNFIELERLYHCHNVFHCRSP